MIPEGLFHDLHDSGITAHTGNGIDLRDLCHHFVLIPFRETTGDDDLQIRIFIFDRGSGENRIDRFLFCSINETTGIDDYRIRLLRRVHQHIFRFIQQIQHLF